MLRLKDTFFSLKHAPSTLISTAFPRRTAFSWGERVKAARTDLPENVRP
jgi:hypothetical protein